MPLIPMVVQFTVEEVRGFRRRMTAATGLLVAGLPLIGFNAVAWWDAAPFSFTPGFIGFGAGFIVSTYGLWLLYSAWARIRDPIRVHEVTRPEDFGGSQLAMNERLAEAERRRKLSRMVDGVVKASITTAIHEGAQRSLLRSLFSPKPPAVELDPANARRVVIVDAGEHERAGRLLGMLADENATLLMVAGEETFGAALRAIRQVFQAAKANGERAERAEDRVRDLEDCQRQLKATEAECLQRADASHALQTVIFGLEKRATAINKGMFGKVQPGVGTSIGLLFVRLEARLRAKKAKKRNTAKKARKR